MDFFGHQEQARQRTAWLVGLYGLAVAGIIVAIYLVIAVVFRYQAEPGETTLSWWMPEVFVWTAIVVSVTVVSGSLVKTWQLSKGGSVVARSLGGRPVAPDTADPAERRLLNVVEEMALAAGTAVPDVYLLDHEEGINAFAAGYSPRDAVIGVTRGCLQQLSRDELQGVIAHEFSHIVNGDMRLNIRLMGVLFGILMITLAGRILLRTAWLSGGRSRRGSDKRGGNPLPFIGLALIVIGYIGVLVAHLIKSAVSRQREFLSDAAAVQYTRNPSGIAGALKKIGGYQGGAKIVNPHAAEASHLFFGNALGSGMAGPFATHPPLASRIKRLDPAFNPDIARLAAGPPPAGKGLSPAASGFTGEAGEVNLAAAVALLDTVPESLRDSVHTPAGARALVYALLLSDNSEVRETQQRMLHDDPAARDALESLRSRLDGLPPKTRLPLAELALPALRRMEHNTYKIFSGMVKNLSEADRKMDLFEFALGRMILRHVAPAFGKVSTAPVRHRAIERILPACESVLTALAVWGTRDETAAQDAYTAGMSKLGIPAGTSRPDQASLAEVARALDVLAEASPDLKRRVLEACRACILADRQVALEQAELLRAVADAMDVPMPPLADAAAA